jgi:hypothetical protein
MTSTPSNLKPSPEKVGVFYLPQMLVTPVQGEFSLALLGLVPNNNRNPKTGEMTGQKYFKKKYKKIWII